MAGERRGGSGALTRRGAVPPTLTLTTVSSASLEGMESEAALAPDEAALIFTAIVHD